MEKVILYAIVGCPYCQKVEDYLIENKLEYERINLPADREDPTRKEIAEKSGVLTTPVIKVGDMYLGESADIIAWLEENKDK